MAIFYIVFIVIIVIGFIFIYNLLRKEVGNIALQLNKINNTKTNSKVLLQSSDKKLASLALEINKILEEKQKTEAEYKRMNLELRQAIANMSHDLRTPLTSIMGYIQLMEDNNLDEEERNEYIDIVKKRAKSLQILISGFYDLSRLESNDYKFELKSINLTNIMYDMIALFYNDFLNKGIEPVVKIDKKALKIIGDENAVKRVFFNLIQNMIKYGDKDVFISLEDKDNCIITIFRNQALKLKEEDVAHLFERFFIGDRARNGDSTGLGLAIVKELIEQMGHEIYAELLEENLSIIIKWNKALS